MKKTMKTLLALMAGVMTFSACSNEDVLTNEAPNVTPEVKDIRTFTAFTDSDGATRATIDGFSIKWQSGDAILVMGNSGEKYTLSDGANTTSGTFTGSNVKGSDIYAVYPYITKEFVVDLYWALGIADEYGLYDALMAYIEGDDDAYNDLYGGIALTNSDDWALIESFLNNTPITETPNLLRGSTIKDVPLPTTQKVSAGQVVDPKAVLMAAKADEVDNLEFKNVCSFIKVTTVTPCKRIWAHTLSDAGTLAGKFDIEMSSGIPKVSSISAGDRHSEVTLEASEGMLAAGTYYIAVLPGTASNGLEIRFYTDNTSYNESKTTSSFTFERNKVYNGGIQPTTTGFVEATGIGYVGWVQLWAGGPKFAEFNVGAANNKAGDCGGYYTWGGSIDINGMSEMPSYYTGSSPLSGVNDTATKLWGSAWRMPTRDEIWSLYDECDDYTEIVDGLLGRIFIGKGDYSSNSVFFPFAGYYEDGQVIDPGDKGGVWSSTPWEDETAFEFELQPYGHHTGEYGIFRWVACSVRAVLAE